MYVLYWIACLALCASTSFASTNQSVLHFRVGERLTYTLYWGIIPVGRADLTTEWVEHEARPMLAIRTRARTNKVVAKIYPVDDLIESIVDPETFLPALYTQKLKEGRHVRDDTIIFDHRNKTARWCSGLSGASHEIAIDSDTRDVPCLVYYMRSKGFRSGQTEKFRVLVDEKIYDLEVMGTGYEDVDVAGMGRVRCLKLEPKARFGEIFVRKGRVNLWVTDDDRHICVRMTGKVPLANVKAILAEIVLPEPVMEGP